MPHRIINLPWTPKRDQALTETWLPGKRTLRENCPCLEGRMDPFVMDVQDETVVGWHCVLLMWHTAALFQVSCDFCRETYTFGEQEVLDALPAEA